HLHYFCILFYPLCALLPLLSSLTTTSSSKTAYLFFPLIYALQFSHLLSIWIFGRSNGLLFYFLSFLFCLFDIFVQSFACNFFFFLCLFFFFLFYFFFFFFFFSFFQFCWRFYITARLFLISAIYLYLNHFNFYLLFFLSFYLFVLSLFFLSFLVSFLYVLDWL